MTYRRGLVIGKFYPLHAGHLVLIRAAMARCERVDVQVLASSVETIPGEVRADWIREEVPGAHVTWAIDDAPVDYGSEHAWDVHVEVMRSLLDGRVDAVFAGEAYGEELARRFDAAWEPVDRRIDGFSGTAIRADLDRWWFALPAPARAWLTRRVVVIGAESTGTTTLAEDLQQHFGLPPVPEFGRAWSADRPGGLETPWHVSEFDLVAREQIRLEDHAARLTPRSLLVCDTDPLATTVWCERYTGARSPTVEALAAARVPDLYLLTGDEIPFVQDGMRDGEHVRHAMQQRFRDVLAAGPAPWVELHGSRDERLAEAITLIDALPGRPLADPMPQAGA